MAIAFGVAWPQTLARTSMNKVNTWEQHLSCYHEADSLYRTGNFKPARAMFKKALALAPGDSDTLWALGSCLSELGKPHQAEHYFRLARARAEFSRRGDLLYNIANALFDQGRRRAALQLYVRVPRSAQSFLQARKNALLVCRQLANTSFDGTPSGTR